MTTRGGFFRSVRNTIGVKRAVPMRSVLKESWPVMRTIATRFLNREALLVLKGRQRVRRWIANVGDDRVITYPVSAPHSVAASYDPVGREVYRYSQLTDILEVAPVPPAH
jgi:hypothetical protein